jgi:hypothetical protein
MPTVNYFVSMFMAVVASANVYFGMSGSDNPPLNFTFAVFFGLTSIINVMPRATT